MVEELNLKKKIYSFKLLTPTRNLLDLNKKNNLNKYFLKKKPDIVIHLAVLNGGIQSNIKYPADFYYKNVTMNNNIFEICARHSVKKLVCSPAGAAYLLKLKHHIEKQIFGMEFQHFSFRIWFSKKTINNSVRNL